MVDTIISVVENLGYHNFLLIVTESGWPSAGLNVATVDNAQAYNNNLIRHVLSNAGTPKRMGRSIETYIFSILNNLIRHVLYNAGTLKRMERSIETYVFAILNENEKPGG